MGEYDDKTSLEEHAPRAADGGPGSLEAVCRGVRDLVYRLALRFSSEPADADDATQEILVKVVTHIGQFDGRSKLTTWVYTVASRHLLRAKRGRVAGTVAGAQAFGDWLDQHLRSEPDVVDEVAYRQLRGDMRISCTDGMLQCLTRGQRITYLLGDLVGLTEAEGAEALDISRAVCRKRLQRARDTMRSVIANRCGLVNAANPCRCGATDGWGQLKRAASVPWGHGDEEGCGTCCGYGIGGPGPGRVLERRRLLQSAG